VTLAFQAENWLSVSYETFTPILFFLLIFVFESEALCRTDVRTRYTEILKWKKKLSSEQCLVGDVMVFSCSNVNKMCCRSRELTVNSEVRTDCALFQRLGYLLIDFVSFFVGNSLGHQLYTGTDSTGGRVVSEIRRIALEKCDITPRGNMPVPDSVK